MTINISIYAYKLLSGFDGLISKVVTQDGYILNMQRIPEGRAGAGDMSKRQPVLIQHGILVVSLTLLYPFAFHYLFMCNNQLRYVSNLFYIQICKYILRRGIFFRKYPTKQKKLSFKVRKKQ